MKGREWLCLLRFGHKWQKKVVGDSVYMQCSRCGKERDPYTSHPGPPFMS